MHDITHHTQESTLKSDVITVVITAPAPQYDCEYPYRKARVFVALSSPTCMLVCAKLRQSRGKRAKKAALRGAQEHTSVNEA